MAFEFLLVITGVFLFVGKTGQMKGALRKISVILSSVSVGIVCCRIVRGSIFIVCRFFDRIGFDEVRCCVIKSTEMESIKEIFRIGFGPSSSHTFPQVLC